MSEPRAENAGAEVEGEVPEGAEEEDGREADVDEEEDEDEDEGEDEDEDEDEEPILPEKLASMCAECGGLCCRYFTVLLDDPEDADDYDELRWFLAHENNYIYIDEDQWHLNVVARCRFLGRDSRCTIYNHRPDTCRDFGLKGECEFTGELDFQHEFRTVGDLEAYARKHLASEELAKLKAFPEGYDDAG